jgi:hypothetical protein
VWAATARPSGVDAPDETSNATLRALPGACEDALDRFAEHVFPGPVEAVDAAALDVDADGILDAVFVNQGAETVSVRRGDPQRKFPEVATWDVGRVESAPVLGDFDGDGVREVALARADANELDIAPLRGGSPGSWEPLFQSLNPRRPVSIDWDRDGVDDVVFQGRECTAWRRGRQGKALAPHACIEPAERSAWLRASLRVGATAWPLVMTVEGLDALAPAPGGGEARHVRLLRETTVGAWSLSGAVYGADSDADGRSELYAFTRLGALLRWALADADTASPTLDAPCTLLAGPSNYGTASPQALADVDGDQVIDLLIARSCSGCTSNHVIALGVRR